MTLTSHTRRLPHLPLRHLTRQVLWAAFRLPRAQLREASLPPAEVVSGSKVATFGGRGGWCWQQWGVLVD